LEGAVDMSVKTKEWMNNKERRLTVSVTIFSLQYLLASLGDALVSKVKL